MADITLKGTPFETSGSLPQSGSKAPAFSLTLPSLEDRDLNYYQGKVKLLYAVPSLDTEVCLLSTKKLNAFAKKHQEIVCLVVTSDLPFAAKRVCGLEHIENVDVLSMMRNKDFARDYGTFIINGPLEGLSARALLIIDKENTVLYSELVHEVTHEPNFEKAFQFIESL